MTLPADLVPPVRPTVVDVLSLGDDALMERSRDGDTRAFEVLVRRHQAAVKRFLSRMVDPTEAGDLTQETFVALWNARHRYEPRGRFTVVLFKTARHKALSHLRWQKVRTVFARKEEARGPSTDTRSMAALEHVLRNERDTRLHAHLRTLSVEMREVLLLRFGEDMDYPQMEQITGVPQGTLRSRAHRALALLANQLPGNEP